MKTVDFIHMSEGTKEEYLFLIEEEKVYANSVADRLLEALKKLEHSFSGYKVSRYEHSLQSATHAYNAGEPEEMVVAALFHDIGDNLAPCSHSEVAAGILRPYVSDRVYWIIKHHGLFQMYYYAHHLDKNRNARECFKDHKWYQDCVDFCENYDQNCFNPDFESKPIAFFEPMVRSVFAEPLAHFV